MMSVNELAKEEFTTAHTVRRWIRDEKLKATQIWRGLRFEYRIKMSDYIEFKKKRENKEF